MSLAQSDSHPNAYAALTAAVPPLMYGVRLAAAVSLSLFLAFYLQLDSPSWAGTTAAIVTQPAVGSTLLKGAFRLLGTCIGAVASVLLTAIFPQDRAGFLFGLLVWAAACSLLSTLLTNFAAYAAMLAGYTLIIIAGSSISAPDQVFELAVARASEISVGIVSGTLIVGLTDLGDARQRVASLLSALIGETAAHFYSALQPSGAGRTDGREVRRLLIARVAALAPVIDQAAGESPELLQRRSLLRAATAGLFHALSNIRIVETHGLRDEKAAEQANDVCRRLPAGSLSRRQSAPSIVRNLLGAGADNPSQRLLADGAAETIFGLAAADNGLALLEDPASARAIARPPRLPVADTLPALINALRVFLGTGAVTLFWIGTAWPNGAQAVTFAAVTIMVYSPLFDKSVQGAVGSFVGTLLASLLAAVVKFGLLVDGETFVVFATALSLALVPLGALSRVPSLAPYFIPAALNFVPLLAPTNEMTFDASSYLNTALGVVGGCAAGALALLLIPHLPPRVQTQRLVDLSIRDLRRLAARPKRWAPEQWQGRIYARLIALPETAAPVERSYLVTALSVGMQIIKLSRIAARGHVLTEFAAIRKAVSAGDLDTLQPALRRMDSELAAVADSLPGARAWLRARSALLILDEAIQTHRGYFESKAP